MGQRVDLECIGEGEPVPTVFWRAPVPRRGDIVPDVAITDPLPGTASLTFERVSETDGGSYICVARNSYGVVEESVDLSGYLNDKIFVLGFIHVCRSGYLYLCLCLLITLIFNNALLV